MVEVCVNKTTRLGVFK